MTRTPFHTLYTPLLLAAILVLLGGCDDPKAGQGEFPVPGGIGGAPPGQTVAGGAGVAGLGGLAATHAYTIRVEGTPGVKLRMLMVAKQPYGAPLREERGDADPIVVKAGSLEIPVQATACYVWFDELRDGPSGKEGDRYKVSVMRDGALLPGGCDGEIKPGVPTACGVGDL